MSQSKTSPFSPHPQQWNVRRSGSTLNEGVFSAWNGQRPLYERPALRSCTRSPTSWTMSTRSLTRSKSPGMSTNYRWAGRRLAAAPGGRDEQALVRVQRVRVGHSRDVVRDGALDTVLIRDALVLG